MAALAGVFALGVAACGGDDDENTAAATATRPAAATSAPTTAVTAAVTAGATAAAATTAVGTGAATITASDFKYAEQDVTTKAGSVKLTLNNTGSAPHTLTLYTDAGYTKRVDGGDTGRVVGGGTGEVTVDLAAGQYFFRCEVHPSPMQGELTAE